MSHHTLTRTLWVLIGVVLILALVPATGLAQNDGATLGSTTLPSLSGVLEAGDNAIFTFGYPGDNREVGFFLTYSPAATGDDNAGPVLEGFRPDDPPPGDPIGRITEDVRDHPGTRLWTLRSTTEGTYMIVVTNADLEGRTINFTLTSARKGATGVFDTAGPALSQVAGTPLPTTPAAAPEPAAVTVPTQPASSTVAGVLGPGQATVITFPYAGDNRQVNFNLGYSPAPGNADPTVEDGLILEAFMPDSSTSDTPIGRITSDIAGEPGNRLWTLRSHTEGVYTIVLTNADLDGRQINFTLRTTVDNGSGEFIIPGPEMTVTFAGQP